MAGRKYRLFDLGDVRQRYTDMFGTSSAAPIVAGAALALQGVRIAVGSPPLSPQALRDLLEETGTPQGGATAESEHIGPLPNLPLAAAHAPSIVQPTPTPRPTPAPLRILGCAASPEVACRAPAVPAQARLVLKDKYPDDKDTLAWSWAKGAAIARSESGDPTTETGNPLSSTPIAKIPTPRTVR